MAGGGRYTLMGRAPELRHLAAAMARVEAGGFEAIVLEGDPGIGKTRLLSELVGRARGLDWSVVEAAGTRSSTEREPSDGPDSPSVEWVERLGDAADERVEGPTLVAVDDAQWLNDTTLASLRELACERRPKHVLVVVAFRFSTREAPNQLRRALEEVGVPTLSLSPLSAAHSVTLAADVLGHEPTGTELARLDETGGVPQRIVSMGQVSSPLRRPGSIGQVPVASTPLVGRGSEVSELAELLTSERLVTIVGVGGCGKTRLAQEVARHAEVAFPGGAHWVELAPRYDQAGVVGAAAQALGVEVRDDRPVAEQIVVAMATRPATLLVLDNAEHVLAPTATLVRQLLDALPQLRVFCTSREPLGGPGEVVWRLQPLPVPLLGRRGLSAAEVERFDSVRLFIDRATRVRRTFVLSEANARAVAEICERVDGLPLAIELVAARVRSMSPERIADQLSTRSRGPHASAAVEQSERSADYRQQTLQASIAWSEELLDKAERAVFRRVGVFVGGFTVDAAQAVASSFADIDHYEVADLLTRLVDKSLVVYDATTDRFNVLETVRAYALERLEAYGELVSARTAHAAWFADWLHSLDEVANALDAQQFIDRTPPWMRSIAPEVANCHAAFEWVETGGVLSLRLTAGLGYYWLMAAAHDEALRYGYAAVAAGDTSTNEWVEAAASLLGVITNTDASAFAILGMAAGFGHDRYSARARFRLALGAGSQGIGVTGPTVETLNQFAEIRSEAAIHRDWFTFTNSTYIPASTCAEFGLIATAESLLGSFVNQRTLLVEGLCALRRGQFPKASTLVNQARVVVEEELMSSAYELSEVAQVGLEISLLTGVIDERLTVGLRSGPNRRSSVFDDLYFITDGLLHLFGDNPSAAARSFAKVLAVSDSRIYPGYAYAWLARVQMALGDTEAAHAAAQSLLRDWTHVRAPYFETTAHLVLAECDMVSQPAGAVDQAHRALAGAAEFELWVFAVDALEAIGAMLVQNGRSMEGARLLGAAQAERDRLGYRYRFAHRVAYVDAAQEVARSTLGWVEGSTLSLVEAIGLAQRMRGERVRPTVGWESLTPTELQVVELVVSGLSNPGVGEKLFMSRATVKTHLVHVYEKLGVHSRAELAALATRVRSAPPGAVS